MNKLSTEYVDLGDIRIAYRQYGSGRALLLLHGNSGSKAMFKPYQLEHFPQFHTFALDSRGHGQSISTDEEITIEQISRDVIRFCEAKGIHQADVIGYSDGGNIALHLANKAPETFPRIITVSPNYLVSGTTDESLHMLGYMLKIMSFLSRLGFNMKKYILRFHMMMVDIGITEEELGSIRTHLKILYAENDMIKEDHLVRLAGIIPHASPEKIMGCTHLTIMRNLAAIRSMQAYLSTGIS